MEGALSGGETGQIVGEKGIGISITVHTMTAAKARRNYHHPYLDGIRYREVIWDGIAARRGEALAMEADVRELRRVQGRLPGAEIVLVDCGLTEDARAMANYLADREKNAEVIDAKEFQIR